MIVDVVIEDGSISIADLITENTVRFLVETKHNVFQFEDEIHTIPPESVCGYYDVDNLEDSGLFVKTDAGYEPVNSDDEYEPSDSDEETDSDVSLEDEEEEEEEKE